MCLTQLQSSDIALIPKAFVCDRFFFVIESNGSRESFFFFKFLEDMSPLCGATDTPVLDF